MLNLLGKKFGHLTVIDFLGLRKRSWDGHKNSWWKIKCDCGIIREICGTSLTRTKEPQTSCGCRRGGVTHGLTRKKKGTIEYLLWAGAAKRARDKNLDFTISPSHIKIPKECPLLKIPLQKISSNHTPNSPTLDRIENTKGYTPENIWVISWRANVLKNDATLKELKTLVENLEEKILEKKITETR